MLSRCRYCGTTSKSRLVEVLQADSVLNAGVRFTRCDDGACVAACAEEIADFARSDSTGNPPGPVVTDRHGRLLEG